MTIVKDERKSFRKWLFGMLVSVALIIVDLVTTAVLVSNNDYEYGLLSDFYSDRYER